MFDLVAADSDRATLVFNEALGYPSQVRIGSVEWFAAVVRDLP